MKRVYRSQSLLEVAHARNILAAAGISAQMRNEYLAGAMGELPMMETWPQLMVEDRDESRALQALAVAKSTPSGQPWICRQCGESLEPQFLTCWRCGSEHSEHDF